MRRYIWPIVALFALLVLPFAVAPGLTERVFEALALDRGRVFRIGTSLPGSDYHQIGDVLAELVAPGLQLVPVPTEGSLDNIERLRRRELDFALVQGWLDVERGELRALAAIAEERVQVVVPEKSDIQRVAELAGRRLLVRPGGNAGRRLALHLVEAYRFDPPLQFVEAQPPFADALLRGHADAAFFAARLGAPQVERLLARGGFRLIPVESAQALADLLVDVEATHIPRGVYGANRWLPPERLSTISVETNLIAHSGTSDAAILSLLEAVYSTSFARRAGLPRIVEAKGQREADLPLHEAALDFYARDEPVSSDEFEIAAFFLALAISLIGLSRYLAERRRLAIAEERRRRIRPYFEALVACDEELHDAEGDTALQILDRMLRLHREAEQRWLTGELDTEDMENFYVRYSTFTQNAFNRIRETRLAGGDA